MSYLISDTLKIVSPLGDPRYLGFWVAQKALSETYLCLLDEYKTVGDGVAHTRCVLL